MLTLQSTKKSPISREIFSFVHHPLRRHTLNEAPIYVRRAVMFSNQVGLSQKMDILSPAILHVSCFLIFILPFLGNERREESSL